MRIDRDMRKKLGIPDAPGPRQGRRKGQGDSGAKEAARARQALFIAACEAHGLPAPVPEFQFARLSEAYHGRMWRFDYCWPESWIALEVQGGLFLPGGGRHSRGAALRDEYEKLNAAAALGWRVLLCLPEDLTTLAILPDLKRVLLP